jgi:transposase InsO family protein
MRREGIVASTERRFRWTATARTELPAAPDRLRRDFTAAAPDRRWVSDITSVRTGQGWLHLAVVLDLYARRVVGWAMAPTLDQALAHEALTMALTERRPAPGLVFHSDRGPSDRLYMPRLGPITYPEHFEVRRVSTNGGIRWNRRWVNVSHILAALPVGLEPLASGTWNLFFSPVHLGWLDERDYRIHDHRGRLTRRRNLSPIR